MDFAEKLYAHAERCRDLKVHADNEEATKSALIQPFLQMMGYDPFDPRVVKPEFTSDIGTKQGEKVDYAVMKNDEPIILMECKPCGCELDQSRAGQLHRYFHNIASARIAILTDGIVYKFFSDIEKQNLMDAQPFMVFNFDNPREELIPELRRLTSSRFEVDNALTSAENLKYMFQIKEIIATEFSDPSVDFVRHFAGKVYSGKLMPRVLEEFKPRIAKAIQHHINDVLNARLSTAMIPNEYSESEVEAGAEESEVENDNGIVTTEEELEGFYIVKAILSEHISPDRVVMRDTKSYCGILLDDNNRKPLCRLHFNTSNKYLGLIKSKDKSEERVLINAVSDIYSHADEIRKSLSFYDG
jgi:hypothetical protein